ncbi:MAG: hypothetical protein AB7I30_00950 [Isosphaeraceae bacterium]
MLIDTKRTPKLLLGVLLPAIIGAMGPANANAASRGCQFIGASKATPVDVTNLSGILTQRGG